MSQKIFRSLLAGFVMMFSFSIVGAQTASTTTTPTTKNYGQYVKGQMMEKREANKKAIMEKKVEKMDERAKKIEANTNLTDEQKAKMRARLEEKRKKMMERNKKMEERKKKMMDKKKKMMEKKQGATPATPAQPAAPAAPTSN